MVERKKYPGIRLAKSREMPPSGGVIGGLIARVRRAFQSVGDKESRHEGRLALIERGRIGGMKYKKIDYDIPLEPGQSIEFHQPNKNPKIEGEIVSVDGGLVVVRSQDGETQTFSETYLLMLQQNQRRINRYLENPWHETDNPDGHGPVHVKRGDYSEGEIKAAKLSQLKAKVGINGVTLEIPNSGTIKLGKKAEIKRDPGGLWMLRTGEKKNGLGVTMLWQDDYEYETDIDGKKVKLKVTVPNYCEFSGKPQIKLESLSIHRFKDWEGALPAKDDELLAFGERNNIQAHGVEVAKGGLKNMVGIVVAREVRSMGYRGDYWGALQAGNPSYCSGPHGPYYVIGNDGNFESFEFVLPDDEAIKYFEMGLREAAQKGLLQESEIADVFSRTHTYEQFIGTRQRAA